jgi:hypothetical protein
MTKLRLVNQGRVVVRGEGQRITVTFPNGRSRTFTSARRAERAARDWLHRNAPRRGAGLGEISWE